MSIHNNEPDFNLSGSVLFTHQDYDPVRDFSGTWRDSSFNGFFDRILKNEVYENVLDDENTKQSVVEAIFKLFFKSGLRNDVVISNLTSHENSLQYEIYPLVTSMEFKRFVKEGYIIKFQLKLWVGKKGSKQLQIQRLVYGKYLNPSGNKGAYQITFPSMELIEEMNPWDNGLDDFDYNILMGIPRRRKKLIQRAASWNAYLDYMVNQIEKEQYCVKINSVRDLNLKSGTLQVEVSTPKDYQRKFRKNSSVAIFSVDSSKDKLIWEVKGLDLVYPTIGKLGNWVEIKDTPKKHRPKSQHKWMNYQTIKVELDIDMIEKYQDNRTGFLNYLEQNLLGNFISNSVIQDLAVYKVQKTGIDRLLRSESENPYLGDFIFDYSKIESNYNYKNYDFASEPLLDLNDEQTVALQKILTNQNVTLVQGPPGTGKTTLIAELAHQASKEGKRVLIASQTNLAVDNAISRLEKVKEILPIRLGNVSRVTEDGIAFVEGNAVNTWFESVEKSLETKVEHEKRTIEINVKITQLKRDLIGHIDFERDSKLKIRELQKMEKGLAVDISKKNRQIDVSGVKISEIKEEISMLDLQTIRGITLSGISLKNYNETTKSGSSVIPWIFNIAKKFNQNQNAFKILVNMKSTLEDLQSLADFKKNLSNAEYELYLSLQKHRDEILEQPSDIEQLGEILEQIKTIENSLDKDRWIQFLDKLNLKFDVVNKISIDDNFKKIRNLDKLLESLRPTESHANTLQEIILRTDEIIKIHGNLADILTSKDSETEKELIKQKSLLENELKSLIRETMSATNSLSITENEIKQTGNKLREAREELATRISNIEIRQRDVLDQIRATEEPITDFQDLIELWNDDNYNILTGNHDQWISLRTKWLKKIRNRDSKDLVDLKDTYIQVANVVGATCYFTGRRNFYEKYGKFDYVVVDEVSKATPPELLLPMLLGEKVVIVGDHRQLPPMYRNRVSYQDDENKDAREISQRFKKLVTTSYFKEGWEKSPETNRHQLLIQYRMHSQIMQNVNHFYRDKPLRMGYKNQDNERFHGFKIKNLLNENNHIVWIDSTRKSNGTTIVRNSAQRDKGETSRYNEYEIQIILKILNKLNQQNIDNKRVNVGVITFYGSQVKKLRSKITPLMQQLDNLSIRFGTVDRFQGAERDIILISLVGALPGGRITGFVRDFRRVNVALSRARKLLVIIGSKADFMNAEIDMSEIDNRRREKIYGKIIDEIDKQRNALREAIPFLEGN